MSKVPSEVEFYNDYDNANKCNSIDENGCHLSKLSEIVDEGKIGEMITWMHAPGVRDSEKQQKDQSDRSMINSCVQEIINSSRELAVQKINDSFLPKPLRFIHLEKEAN